MPLRRLAPACCLLFLAAFYAYLKTSCSSVYPDDSGETATLAWTLSIGHPPGYPLHTLAARIFSLLPLGDPALRINLFAALLAALTAPMLFLAGGRSLIAVVGFGVGAVLWHNAGVAKGSVYMLNNLATLACLLAASARRERMFWMLLGLGLAHHYMSQLVMLPAYALLLVRGRDWRGALRRAWWVLPGLSLYLFLPLRAQHDPPINWNNIRSLEDFLFYFSRAQYAGSEFTRGLAISARQAGHGLLQLWREGHGVLSVLALAGLWLAWRGRERGLAALAAGIAAPLAAVAFYLNLSADRLDIMQPYLFPAYLCQALLAGRAAAWLLPKIKAAAPRAGLALGLGAAFLFMGGREWKAADKSDYHYALDNARNVLQSLPPGSALFAAGDAIIFPIWYLQQVKAERRDVVLVGTPVLPMDWVRSGIARRYPDFLQPGVRGRIGAESIDRLVHGMLELNVARRPLFLSYNKMNAGIPGWKLLPQGPAYLALPAAAAEPSWVAASAESRLKAAVTRGFERQVSDPRTLNLVIHDFAVHHNSLGTWLEERKDFTGALAHYKAASHFHPQSEEYPYNQGNALHQMGRLEEARSLYRSSLTLNPGYIDAWFNLAVTDFKVGRTDEACGALRRILELDPARSDVRAQLERCRNIQ